MMSATPSSDGTASPEILRQQLTAYLKNLGHIRTPAVEAAFRTVPRHLFVPGERDLQKIYSDTYILTKMLNGVPISSSSQPAMMAIMLELLDLQPGQRVLEIGAGTGYNAALLAHIVGEHGRVVTIDIDEDIVQAARAHLVAAGCPQVQVQLGDGVIGYPDLAPYDRIILTACTSDVALAWLAQLKPGGRLLAPFKLTTLTHIPVTRSWLLTDQILLAFEARADHLVCVADSPCGFMALRGVSALPGSPLLQIVPGDGFFTLANPSTTITAAATIFKQPTDDIALPFEIGDLDLSGFRIWLALRDPAYCELFDQEKALGTDINTPLIRLPGATLTAIGLYDGQGMCLLTRPPDLPGEQLPSRLILHTFGTRNGLADRLQEQFAAWNDAGRPFRWGSDGLFKHVRLRVYPVDTTYKPAENEMMVVRSGARLVFRFM
jgi:protein-L-isoaspartate(D-aspartate) O-methyltransferase